VYAGTPYLSDINRFVGLTETSYEWYSIEVSVSGERQMSKHLAYLRRIIEYYTIEIHNVCQEVNCKTKAKACKLHFMCHKKYEARKDLFYKTVFSIAKKVRAYVDMANDSQLQKIHGLHTRRVLHS
jgi:hypothetical protein